MNDDPGRSGAQTDEERARAYREQLKQLHAVDVASTLMVDLVTIGYQKLGLTPETADLRDLRDARLFIDLLRATLGVVESELDDMQRRDLQSTLAQMQLSFARAVQLGGAESRPAQTPAEAPAPEAPKAEPAGPADVVDAPEGPEAGEAETAARPAAKKTAAKKPTARKPVAKKPTAKKPAAKPAQKRRAPRKPGGASPDA
jgi:hypothetical protein